MHLAPYPPDLGVDLCDPIADHPLNQGRVGWWLALPETVGGPRFYDLTVARHGTLTNMASPATAASGWGLTSRPGGWGQVNFDGTDDEVAVASLPHPQVRAFWFRSPLTAGDMRALHMGNNHSAWINGATVNATYNSSEIVAGGAAAVGQWHRLVAIFRPSAGLFSVFVDGRQVGSSVAATALAGSSTVRIGTAGFQYFLGAIDDVSLWSSNRLADANPAAFVSLDYDQSRRGYPDALRRVRPSVAAFFGPAPTPTFRPYFLPTPAVIGSGVY